MKVIAYLSAAILLIQQTSGCEKPQTAAPIPAAKEIHLPPLHRFVNVPSPVSPGIALDTVTGQFCRTWEWTYKAKEMNGGLDTVPTCLSVFYATPASDTSVIKTGDKEIDSLPDTH